MNETVEMVTNMRAQIDAVIASHNEGSWRAETHFIGDRVSFLTGTAKARPEDSNQLTRHTGTVERREILRPSETATIGFVQYDIRDDATGRVINVNSGRVRMLDNQERPVVPEHETVAPVAPVTRPCDYCHTSEHAGCPDCGTHPYMRGGRCTSCQFKFRKAEREAGMSVRERYGLYISDGLADTDGHFAPLSFEAWAHSEGIAL